jgi:hypothetical protein
LLPPKEPTASFELAFHDGGDALVGVVMAGVFSSSLASDGSLVGVVGLANLDAPLGVVAAALVGELVGVMCRRGEGEAGDSPLRNGEFRTLGGDPRPRGEGLNVVEIDWG